MYSAARLGQYQPESFGFEVPVLWACRPAGLGAWARSASSAIHVFCDDSLPEFMFFLVTWVCRPFEWYFLKNKINKLKKSYFGPAVESAQSRRPKSSPQSLRAPNAQDPAPEVRLKAMELAGAWFDAKASDRPSR